MPRLGHVSRSILRLAGAVVSLISLDAGASAKGAGAPENFDPRSKYRYSFEYYRSNGVFGRKGERLSPKDPRGHMSHGHGGLSE